MIDRIFGFIGDFVDVSIVNLYICGKVIGYMYMDQLFASFFFLIAVLINLYKRHFNDSSQVRFWLFIAFVIASLMEYYNTTH